MSTNSGSHQLPESEYEYFLSMVGVTMPTCPKKIKDISDSPKKAKIQEYNAFEHSITTQTPSIATPIDQSATLPTETITHLPAEVAQTIPVEQIILTQTAGIDQPSSTELHADPPTLDPTLSVEQTTLTQPALIDQPVSTEATIPGYVAPTELHQAQTLGAPEKSEEEPSAQAQILQEEHAGPTTPQTQTAPAQTLGTPEKSEEEPSAQAQILQEEKAGSPKKSSPTKTTEPEKPLPKGSFTAKFANTVAKDLVFVVENLGHIDRTLNESFKFAGYNYAVNTNGYTYTRGLMHSLLSVVDAFTTEKYQYLPILSTVAFNVNLHSRVLNDHHPLIQCTLETLYGSVRNIVDHAYPTTFAVSAVVNVASCLNRELNEHSSKEYIASFLNTVRSLMHFQSVPGPFKLVPLLLRTGWNIKDMYDLYAPALRYEADPVIKIKFDTSTEPIPYILDSEADPIIKIEFNASTDAIPDTLGNINSTET